MTIMVAIIILSRWVCGDSSYSTFPVYRNTVKVRVPFMVIEFAYPVVGSPRELNVIVPPAGLAFRLILPSKILVKFLVLFPPPAAGNTYSVELNVRVLLACLAIARACTDRISDFIMSAAVSSEMSLVAEYFCMATHARIPIMTITMISSIKVNPS